MPGFPAKTQLQPNPLGVYCQFHAYCRGGQARWTLALGPARNTWIHLCDACVRSMITLFPAGLLIHAATVAHEQGLPRAPKELLEMPDAPPVPFPSTPPPPTPERTEAQKRESVLAYLEAHADDEEFMAEVAAVLEGEPERELTVIPVIDESPESRLHREITHRLYSDDAPEVTLQPVETAADSAPAPAELKKGPAKPRKRKTRPRTKVQK